MEFTADALERAKNIKMVIFDVDGVLTDGGIYIGEKGELYKSFFCRDGMGITLWHRAGLQTAIITGRESVMLANRAKELKIGAVWQGRHDKRAAYAELKEQFSLDDAAIAYIGDDIIDLPLMLQAGLAAAVSDAASEAREAAQLVSAAPGGRGAVREILEFILKAQGRWAALVADFMGPKPIEKIAQ